MDRRFVMLAGAGLVLFAACGQDNRNPSGAEAILKRRPFQVVNPDMIGSSFYSGAVDYPGAPGPELGEDQARERLADYLTVEFPDDPASRASAMAIFGDSVAGQKIPSPVLRAAVAALRATFVGKAAVDYILHAVTQNGRPKVLGIRFEALGDDDSVYLVPDCSAAQVIYRLNEDEKGENPFLFVSAIAHEVLHQDCPNSPDEEATNSTFEGLVALKQLARHPELARVQTKRAQHVNAIAMRLLNSGVGSRLGILASNNDQPILPGSRFTNSSFYSFLPQDPAHPSSPANDLLGSYLAQVQEPGKPKCSAAVFDQSLIQCLDQNLGAIISAKDLVAAAAALEWHE